MYKSSPLDKKYFIEGTFLLDVHQSAGSQLLSHLNSYILREEIIIKNISHEYTVFVSEETGNSPILFEDPRSSLLGYRGLMRNPILTTIQSQKDNFAEHGQMGLSYDPIYSLKRILMGCPEFPFDMIPGSSLPFECNLDVFNFSRPREFCLLFS